jgi:hypothetical protein
MLHQVLYWRRVHHIPITRVTACTAPLSQRHIEPPLALFIAAVPILKMVNSPKGPLPVRAASHLLDGDAKPVGGDAEGAIRVTQ